MSVPVCIIGQGKLARALKTHLEAAADFRLVAWPLVPMEPRSAGFLVHAGSGREIPAVTTAALDTGWPVLELSTGLEDRWTPGPYGLVFCPNTSLLLLQTMAMLRAWGPRLQNFDITLAESHQASKTSAPGTALALARALGLDPAKIVSVRDPEVQRRDWAVPEAFLDRHAFHRLTLSDGAAQVSIETRIAGHEPYAKGLVALLRKLVHLPPVRGQTSILELLTDL